MTRTPRKPDSAREAGSALGAALEECRAYNRIGGLDASVMADIAHDNRVPLDKLKQAWAE